MDNIENLYKALAQYIVDGQVDNEQKNIILHPEKLKIYKNIRSQHCIIYRGLSFGFKALFENNAIYKKFNALFKYKKIQIGRRATQIVSWTSDASIAENFSRGGIGIVISYNPKQQDVIIDIEKTNIYEKYANNDIITEEKEQLFIMKPNIKYDVNIVKMLIRRQNLIYAGNTIQDVQLKSLHKFMWERFNTFGDQTYFIPDFDNPSERIPVKYI